MFFLSVTVYMCMVYTLFSFVHNVYMHVHNVYMYAHVCADCNHIMYYICTCMLGCQFYMKSEMWHTSFNTMLRSVV